MNEDRVVYVKLMIFDDGTKGKNFYDMDKHDMSVRIETGSPKIVYISPFVDEVLDFIIKLGTSREAMYEAGAAAALAAKENVQQTDTFRVLLDINLKAPVVVCPRNEQSPHTLLADLGRLILKNQFEKKQSTDSDKVVIIDRIEINLMNIKVSRYGSFATLHCIKDWLHIYNSRASI